MARARVSIAIGAPPDRVWDDVRHIDRHVEWMRDAVAITFDTPQREGAGTAFTCATRVGPLRANDRMVVTEWADGETIGIRHDGVVKGRGRFTLTPEGTGTRLTWDEELRFPWWLGGELVAGIAARALRRVWRRNLEALRARLA